MATSGLLQARAFIGAKGPLTLDRLQESGGSWIFGQSLSSYRKKEPRVSREGICSTPRLHMVVF